MVEMGIKGNTADNARKRRKQQTTRVAAMIIGILILYVSITTLYQSHFSGIFVSDIEVDEHGRARIRRRPYLHRQRLDPNQKTSEYDAVLEGYLTLLDISIPPSALRESFDDASSSSSAALLHQYKGVTAKFCHIDWSLQQTAPHKVPMFNDLARQSKLCDTTVVTVDLWEMAHRAREYDEQLLKLQQPPSSLQQQQQQQQVQKIHSLQSRAKATTTIDAMDITAVAPTGILFHESRCGSTLLSNLLAGFSPNHSRVYSEANAHRVALLACMNDDIGNDAGTPPCNTALHKQLIQDVFYLSGRTVRKERPQYVFYKISSIGTMALEKFAKAMPRVPWAYLYRDTVEVMQSHLVPSTIAGGIIQRNRKSPVCLRYQNQHPQPMTTIEVASNNRRDLDTMTREEYCATHLAALSLSALHEHRRSGKGRFINYNQLPDIVWDKLLPKDYGITVGPTEIERMQQISQLYSKDRTTKKDGIHFEEDATQKKKTASQAVVNAARTFAGDIYERMETLSKKDK